MTYNLRLNQDMSRIFSLFFTFFFIFSAASYAADATNYLVEGVTVNVSGKTPSAARNSAVATARRDAFLILLTRLEMNINTADNITDDDISDMVRSEQIDNEKIAGNNYSATFNIMFAKDFVEHILAQRNSKNSEIKKENIGETYLLIPVKMVKQQTLLWEGNNDWKKAVEKTLAQKSQNKFIIPDSDVSNIAVVNRDNISAANYVMLEPMLLRYKSEGAYTMFFDYDSIENKVAINVFYIRKLQKKQIKLSFINVDRLSYEDLIDKVADKTIGYLLSIQNSENKILNSNLIHIKIRINSFGNWLMIKNKIENSNLVNQLNIESISRDYAVISVNYIDAKTNIKDAFANIGINLNQQSDNSYIIN